MAETEGTEGARGALSMWDACGQTLNLLRIGSLSWEYLFGD